MSSLSELKAFHAKIKSEFDATISNALDLACDEIKLTVKSDTSFGGNKLRNSIRFRKSKYAREIYTTNKHAAFIEFGTRPHQIRARNVQFLKFEMGGVTHFRKVVNHPGIKETKFFTRAIKMGEYVLATELHRNL